MTPPTPISSIRATDLPGEEALTRGILESRPEIILVVSDLHLGPGRDPTGVFDPRENFFLDDAFASWLAGEDRATAPRLLVLLGDIFDFTRLDDVPQKSDVDAWRQRLDRLQVPVPTNDLWEDIIKQEERFGLRTHEHKSVWKLYHMIEGHSVFMTALANWVKQGNYILFLKGNHDLELFWPAVRRAIRDEIVERGASPEDAQSRVAFSQTGVAIENLYFEHGHQYEAMTRVVGPDVLAKHPHELNYPLGSFLNRYIVNRIERLDPFIDNIKPVQDAVLLLLRKQPLRILGHYKHAWRFLWRVFKMKRAPSWTTFLIGVGLILPPLLLLLGVALLVFPSFREIVPFITTRWRAIAASVGGVVLPFVFPYLISAIREVARAFGRLRPHDHVAEGAMKLLRGRSWSRAYRRVYAIMGHTHRATVLRHTADGREEFYLNTGTWIPLWPQDRRDLIGRTVLTFVRLQRQPDGEYRHETQEWADEGRNIRAARILRSPADLEQEED